MSKQLSSSTACFTSYLSILESWIHCLSENHVQAFCIFRTCFTFLVAVISIIQIPSEDMFSCKCVLRLFKNFQNPIHSMNSKRTPTWPGIQLVTGTMLADFAYLYQELPPLLITEVIIYPDLNIGLYGHGKNTTKLPSFWIIFCSDIVEQNFQRKQGLITIAFCAILCEPPWLYSLKYSRLNRYLKENC